MINEEEFSQISDNKSSLVFEYENKEEFKQYLLELPQKLRYKVVSKIELIVQYGLATSMQKELVKKLKIIYMKSESQDKVSSHAHSFFD